MLERLEYRVANPKDIPEIGRLHQLAFRKHPPAEHIAWQFYKNPHLSPFVWVAEASNGGNSRKIVGHYSLVPVPFRVQKKSAFGAFSILSMIDPNLQKQGILKTLEERSRESLAKMDLKLLIAFLNVNSFPVYTKRFRWQEVGKGVPVFMRALFLPEFRKSSNEFRLNISNNITSQYPRLWEKFSEQFGFCTDRNRSYMQWRYVENPKEYEILELLEGENLVGHAVVRMEVRKGLKVLLIADCIWEKGRLDVAEALFHEIARVGSSRGARFCSALVPEHESIRTAYKGAAFIRVPRWFLPHPMHLCYRFTDEVLPRPAADEWYFSWSDHDVA